MPGPNPRPLAARFWEKVDRRGEGECWPWTASLNAGGYGQLTWQQRPHPSNRLAWMLTHGDIPDGLIVRHMCHVRHCCNPAHLRLGTKQDNSNDMTGAGRQKSGSQLPQCRISTEEVWLIRRLFGLGISQANIARLMEVHPSHVSRIVRGLKRKAG